MELAQDFTYVGVDDHAITLFEGQFPVPQGMSYNSYLIEDEKCAVMDSVDAHFASDWIENITKALDGRTPDYLVIHHMEPDHSGSIAQFMEAFPQTTIVINAKIKTMLENFFGTSYNDRNLIVKNGDELNLGKHTLQFVFAPMVHWPEVMMSFDTATGTLFSADAFGKFGALDVDEPWIDEARRYFFGIVGPYGKQVQALFKKAAALDIKAIYPLHGPVLTENLDYYLNLYKTWSAYEPEETGVTLMYASVYGHTKKAVEYLAEKLKERNIPVVLHDLTQADHSEVVADAFKYSTVVCASVTYNGSVFPAMRDFLNNITERKFQNRRIAFIENGSWAPMATKVMKQQLENCPGLTFVEKEVTLHGALHDESKAELDALAEALSA